MAEKSTDDVKENAESMMVVIQKRIEHAFNIFDDESNKTVDVREVGTIVRSLGCCPSEEELKDMRAEIEDEEPTGFIHYEKFLPMMTTVLLNRRYRPQPEEMLLKAFQVLDVDNNGYLTQEEFVNAMTTEGEVFSEEEKEEMLTVAFDPDKKIINYKEYVSLLAVEET